MSLDRRGRSYRGCGERLLGGWDDDVLSCKVSPRRRLNDSIFGNLFPLIPAANYQTQHFSLHVYPSHRSSGGRCCQIASLCVFPPRVGNWRCSQSRTNVRRVGVGGGVGICRMNSFSALLLRGARWWRSVFVERQGRGKSRRLWEWEREGFSILCFER